MTVSGLLVFCAVYLLAAMTPGPGILALISKVLVRGGRGLPLFVAGFVVGDLIWFTLAASGLSLLAQTFEALFIAIKYAGAAFLFYLAYRFWTAPVETHEITAAKPEGSWQLFLGGLAITLGNPKVVIFFMALLPTVVDLAQLTLRGFIEIGVVISLGLTAVLTAYALAAMRVRQFFLRPRAIKRVNRGSSVMMAMAGVAVASR